MVAQVIGRNGQYLVKEHQQLFFDTFGPCGSYHGFADRPTKALIARMIIDAEKLPELSGSDDDQLPALSSVPALFLNEASDDDVTSAVSVTHTNALALSGAKVLNSCLNRIHDGESLTEALNSSVASAEPALAELLNDALVSTEFKPLETAQRFGMACQVVQGLPLAWHLLQHAEDYESIVRENIRCGGDSCGRSIAVGSIAGLVFGVPDGMKSRVNSLL